LKGHWHAVPANVELEKGDIRDKSFLNDVFTKHKPDAVMVLAKFTFLEFGSYFNNTKLFSIRI